MFWEISHISQENTCARISFLIRLQEACNFVKKETLAQVFSSEFSKIFNTSYRTHPLATSEKFVNLKGNFCGNFSFIKTQAWSATLLKISHNYSWLTHALSPQSKYNIKYVGPTLLMLVCIWDSLRESCIIF